MVVCAVSTSIVTGSFYIASLFNRVQHNAIAVLIDLKGSTDCISPLSMIDDMTELKPERNYKNCWKCIYSRSHPFPILSPNGTICDLF